MEQKRNYHEPCACQKPAPVPCDKPKCDDCRGSKCNCFCLPPKVIPVEVDGCPILFRKVIIPVSVGDETTYPPVNGLYRNVLLEYESSGSLYLYSSDGIPTHIVNDLEQITKLIRELVEAEAQTRAEADDHLQDNIDSAVTTLSKAIGEETSAREGADRILDGKIEAETTARGLADQTLDGKITDEKTNREDADRLLWAEINLLEIASDVVDIVGTYAALQAYDTSKLQDNDIIKVLKDETHSNATTYYRWNKTTSQFAYIGEEGPYYTTSQTDLLLAGKQDTLTAGSNIQINDNVISATDTTYTAGTGINITNGVISSTSANATTLYVGSSSNEYRFYYDAAKTEQVTYQEMIQLLKAGDIKLVVGNGSYAYVNAYSIGTGECYIFSYDSGMYRSYRWDSSYTYASLNAHYLQDQLTAGSNITINNRTISATDTTYTAGTGLTLTGTEFAVDTTTIAQKTDIPTVNDATLTITQNGVSAGTFTANASSNVTIALTDTVYTANNINSTDWDALWQ